MLMVVAATLVGWVGTGLSQIHDVQACQQKDLDKLRVELIKL